MSSATMGGPRLMVIGGKLKIVQKARRLGAQVCYVQRPNSYTEAHRPFVDSAILVDYEDVPRLVPIARGFHEAYPLRHVISLTESGLVPAANVNDACGLGGCSLETTVTLMNKATMRERLNQAGLGRVAMAGWRDRRDLVEFIDHHGLPVIVKPLDSSGSIGILLLRTPADVDPALATLGALGVKSFLAEEFLEGTEVSVETLSFGGEHVVVGITDKLTNSNFVEIGHSMPSRISIQDQREVTDLVRACLDLVGLRDGPAHTEVMLTARGPRIIESHNRIGGDRINEMAEQVYGVDMDALALGAPLGLAEPLRASPAPRGGAAIRFFTPPAGVVEAVEGIEGIESEPGVMEFEMNVAAGDDVRTLNDSDFRVGFVQARGDSVDEAVARCEGILRRVRVVTRPLTAAAV